MVEPTQEELTPRPPRSKRRRVFDAVIALTAYVGFTLLITSGTAEAVRLMVFGVAVTFGMELWSRWQARRPSTMTTMAAEAIEAAEVATVRLDELRALSYEQFIRDWLDRPRSEHVVADTGKRHDLIVSVSLDDPPGRDIRVWVTVTYDQDRVGRSLTRGFILQPDGSFAGEPVSRSASPAR